MGWQPPASDRTAVSKWTPPESDADVGRQQQAATERRAATAPGWMGAFFPNMTAAGGNPMQDLATFGAGFKDLAALPANLVSGAAAAFGAAPGQASVEARRAMASADAGDMDQTQRAVLGLSLAGSPIGGAVLRAIPAAAAAGEAGGGVLANFGRVALPFAQRVGRQAVAGAAESAPAAAFQASQGDLGGAAGAVGLGALLRPVAAGLSRAPGAIATGTEHASGALSGVPGHELAAIGPFGLSDYGRKVSKVAKNPEAAQELGQKVVDRVKNFDQYLPNATEVDDMIAKLPPIDANKIIRALEDAKTSIRIKGEKGQKISGVADVFESYKSPKTAVANRPPLTEVSQEFAQLEGPQGIVPFSNVSRSYRGKPAGLLGMEEKGLPEIRRNPQVIPDVEPIGEATYTQTTKGTKGKRFNATPEGAATDAKIDKVISMLRYAQDKDGKIPAYAARMIKQQYDVAVGDAFGKESSAYISALKNARHSIAKSLEEAAEESGVPEYKQAMQDYTRRLGALDKVTAKLGGDEKTMRSRVEAYISNLGGANKTEARKAFAELADIMGEDFAEQAKAIATAKKAMPGGSLALLPTQTTGRALLGGKIASDLATGGGTFLAGAPVAALSSPFLASGAIAGTRGLANLAGTTPARYLGLAGLAGLRSELQAENAGR